MVHLEVQEEHSFNRSLAIHSFAALIYRSVVQLPLHPPGLPHPREDHVWLVAVFVQVLLEDHFLNHRRRVVAFHQLHVNAQVLFTVFYLLQTGTVIAVVFVNNRDLLLVLNKFLQQVILFFLFFVEALARLHQLDSVPHYFQSCEAVFFRAMRPVLNFLFENLER